MKETTYKGFTIKAERATAAADVARIYDEYGTLYKEIFSMRGENDAIRGARKRIDAIGVEVLETPSLYRRGLALVKVLKNRVKNRIARKQRKINAKRS